MHIISTQLLQERLTVDAHALGLEESRGRGLLRPDSTSVIIHDKRSKACQLLTVGEATIVSELCSDAWQGEHSTIKPLAAVDRKAIIEASKNWNLADLDVAVFSYAPVPHFAQQDIETFGDPDTVMRLYFHCLIFEIFLIFLFLRSSWSTIGKH